MSRKSTSFTEPEIEAILGVYMTLLGGGKGTDVSVVLQSEPYKKVMRRFLRMKTAIKEDAEKKKRREEQAAAKKKDPWLMSA
jgi:hypothetical protein